jgi:hypothetical protein
MKALLISLTFLLSNTILLASYHNLESNNPFSPPKKQKIQPDPLPQKNGLISREMEFHGVFKMGGVCEFSLFDKKLNKSYWIMENCYQNGVKVSNFDATNMTIEVTKNDITEKLKIFIATYTPKKPQIPRRRVILPNE